MTGKVGAGPLSLFIVVSLHGKDTDSIIKTDAMTLSLMRPTYRTNETSLVRGTAYYEASSCGVASYRYLPRKKLKSWLGSTDVSLRDTPLREAVAWSARRRGLWQPARVEWLVVEWLEQLWTA